MGTVSKTVKRGGRCLIPVFALGRAQELLLILDEYWQVIYRTLNKALAYRAENVFVRFFSPKGIHMFPSYMSTYVCPACHVSCDATVDVSIVLAEGGLLHGEHIMRIELSMIFFFFSPKGTYMFHHTSPHAFAPHDMCHGMPPLTCKSCWRYRPT